MCLMFECDERGVLASGGVPWTRDEIAAAVGGDPSCVHGALDELLRKGVASLSKLGAITNRRMVRDEEQRADNRARQHNYYKSHKTKENTNGDITVDLTAFSHASSSSSSSSKKKQEPPPLPPRGISVPAVSLPEHPPWLDRETWEGFVEMRKKIHAPLTSRAIDGIFRKLGDLRRRGHDANACLDQSTERAWRGVFEVKSNQASPPKTRYANEVCP